jgi:hypothetical protein
MYVNYAQGDESEREWYGEEGLGRGKVGRGLERRL